MKKLYLFLMFTLLLLLGGCSRLEPSPHGEIPADETVRFTTQYPVYADDVQTISFRIENAGEGELSFGVEYALEKLTASGWMAVPYAKDVGFVLPLYTVMPGGRFTDSISMHMFDHTLSNGTYRILKEINDKMYAAEFIVGDSPITAITPHGYAPLESLPENYSAEDALADGVVIRRLDGTLENTGKIDEFFSALFDGYSSQLRLCGFTDEGQPVLSDLLVDQDRICFRRDNGRGIEQTYFAAFVTDGNTLALSNTFTWLENDTHRMEIFELNTAWEGRSTLLESLPNLYESIDFSPLRQVFWSPDGLIAITIRYREEEDPRAFLFNQNYADGGSRGQIDGLGKYRDKVSAISDVLWSADSKTAVFVCEASDGGSPWYFTYDVQKNQVTEIHRDPK